jgi:hypothetical protein
MPQYGYYPWYPMPQYAQPAPAAPRKGK